MGMGGCLLSRISELVPDLNYTSQKQQQTYSVWDSPPVLWMVEPTVLRGRNTKHVSDRAHGKSARPKQDMVLMAPQA